MKKLCVLFYHQLLLFYLLGIFFIPFSFTYPNVQPQITKFLFEDLILFLASNFKNISLINSAISSDSTTFYWLLLVLFFLAIVLAIIFSFLDFPIKRQSQIMAAIQLLMTFYLSLIMLKYGIDKVFQKQFYLPEPNILFTPLGMLDKDILFWSTMGVSYTYNLFMGLLEVIPALLLLSNKTRILGIFILSGVLLNVVFINFGFDISVKLYSLFLLFCCFLLLAPSAHAFLHFFVLHKPAQLKGINGETITPSKNIRLSLKGLMMIGFFVESLFPYIQAEEYHDNSATRKYLHGAYEILEVKKEKKYEKTLNTNIKRVFIHRHNYFIFQYADDSMQDFHLEIKPNKSEFILTDYDGKQMKLQYHYSENSKILEFKFVDYGITFYSKSLLWQDLPLLQPLFHWTVDEIH